MGSLKIYRKVAGRTVGPYDSAELAPLVADGRISSLDRFSYDGTSWDSLDAFPELSGKPRVDSAPPVGPPPLVVGDSETPSSPGGDIRKPTFRRNLVVLFVGLITIACGVAVAVFPGSFLGFGDIGSKLLDSPESLQGQTIVLEGYYQPRCLRPLSDGRYEIGFSVGDDGGVLVSGSPEERFHFVARGDIGERLMLSTGSFRSLQPARVTLAVGHKADNLWPTAELVEIAFFKGWPLADEADAFLVIGDGPR